MEFKDRMRSRMQDLGLRATDVAERVGVSRGTISFWMSGTNGAKGKNLLQLARVLDCDPEWLTSGKVPHARDAAKTESNAVLLGDAGLWEESEPANSDDVEVPFYAEVEFAGGGGMTEVTEVAGSQLRFGRDVLRSAGVDPSAAACARVKGRSMERLISDGAVIGFDRFDTSIIDGEIYAFNHAGMLRVKFLYKLPGGAVRVRSENSDEYPDETLTHEQFIHDVKILGRVFWWSTIRRSPRR